MSHVYPDPIQGPNSPLAKSFSYEPMPHCPQLVFNQVELRDFFAAAALQGILARGQSLSSKKDEVLEAFKYSDAMLKAREVKP